MTPVGTSQPRPDQDLIPDGRRAWDVSPDWIFAIILILGLADTIDEIIAAAGVCNRDPASATAGRRTLMVVGFLIAATAGAGLLSRRLVSPGL